MDGHLSEERLAAVLGEDLDPADAAHLAACAACRARLDERRRDEALFGELARAVPPARVEPAALLAADAIAGYELLGEIQCGGQGTVYLARQRSTRREVALKVLARGSAATPRERRRFEREVDLASRLRHPGIVRVYESGESAGRPWYAMELAEGERLDAYVRERALDRDARLALFERIADAVAYAHRCGVIHRDLKPANILVDPDGEPHIVDFGLALAASERAGERLTATGEFLGTLDWSSPEQVRGEAVDTRTDVHALGLLLYSMLTGRLPWPTSGSVSELLRRIEHDPPLDPRGLSRGVDDELRTVLVTALAKEPAERYASADALLRDLRHWHAREPLEARAHSTGYVLRLALARHRVGVATAVAALLALGGVTAVLVRGHWRAERQREQAALVRQLVKDVAGASAPMGDESARLAVLEDSLARLESDLDASADVQAALLLALGEAHAARLHHDEAEPFLRRAVARMREADDVPGTVRALEALSGVLAQSGAPEAVSAAEEALALLRAQSPADDAAVATCERQLAVALLARLPEREGDDERARALLDRSLATLRARLGDEDPEVAATQVQRARVAASRDAALELYATALAVLERRPGEARRTIECLDGYSGVLSNAGRYEEAEELLRRSALLTRQTYGERHTVDHLRRRARIERLRGNLAASELLARAAVATEIDGWVERRPGEARVLEALSASVRAESPPPFVEAFAKLRELRGDGDFALSSWMNGTADLLAADERQDEAEALLRESLHIHCRVYGPDCPNRMRTLFQLAELLATRECASEARTCLEELLAAVERTGDAESEFADRARTLLAQLGGPTPVAER